MAFTKSFSQMQDEINDIFIQHHSETRAEEVCTTVSALCILVQLNNQVKLKELEDISALTGDNKFEKLYNEGNYKYVKGGVTMCEIVQSFIDEGIEQGKAEEKAQLIRRMLDENFATPQQIASLLKISVREVKKLASKIPAEA